VTENTYQVWNGEYWTFEQILDNLQRLIRSIVAKTTPEERIDDCMQEAWLRLYERLEADPQALGPDPTSKSPRHTRSYYANRIAWDAHKGYGFGPRTQTYYERHIPESELYDQDYESDEYHFGDVPGLDTVLFADRYHRRWMDEADVRLDLEDAVEKFLCSIQPKYMPRFAMAVLCILHREVTLAQGATLVGTCRDTMRRDVRDARRLLQMHLHDYQLGSAAA
jgi:hypothetical protein